ncbi:MAG: NAD-dependent epimerase/dehydratase family protein [Oceanococcus sp.]
MATYLVTGGAGFIGSHLCDALLRAGHAVRVIDDLSSGKRENLAADAEFTHACISDQATVQKAFEGIDGCFHLAAIASVERSCQEWLETHRINLSATVNILDCARRNCTPVVYASSAAIYGDNPNVPLLESEAANPTSPYGADKAGMELHAQAAAASFGLASTGLRFFNVYGPRQDPHSPYSGVISIFAQRLKDHRDISIHGDGQQTRDFIYVADVVRSLLQAMQSNVPTVARVLNVCTGRQTSIQTLAELLRSLIGSASKIGNSAARNGDIRHSCGNPAAAHKALGHTADVDLRDGLLQLLGAST